MMYLAKLDQTEGRRRKRGLQFPARHPHLAVAVDAAMARVQFDVEPLESRLLLSTVTWTSTTGGAWSSAANWSTGTVPQPGDDVVVKNPPGAAQATITLSGDVSVNSVALTGDTLAVAAGATLTTAGAVNNAGTITVSNGAQVDIGGAYTESAGAALSLQGDGSVSDPASNLLANTNFESPVISASGTIAPESWTTYGSAYLSSQYAYSGSQSLQTSGANSGAMQSFPVTPGESYTLSTYAMTPAADPLTGTEEGSLELIFIAADGNQISSYAPPNLDEVLTSSSSTGGPLTGSVGSDGWNHFNMTAVAPSGAATVNVTLAAGEFNGYGAGGGSVYWDAPQFGPSSTQLTAASIVNSGRITVAPLNVLDSNGTFTQTSTGTLDVQLGGSPSSSDFGYVTSASPATLAGTLQSDIVNGYVPSTTDVFTVMEYPSETGTFGSYSLAGSSAAQFQGSVTFTNVVLASEPTAALTTTVNATSDLHPTNADLVGVNLAEYDSDLTTSQTQQMVEQVGTNLYRFPGGSVSDQYHFNTSTNLGNPDAATIAQFAQFIQSVNGTGMITVDYGSGSPQEAAAEMAYLMGSPSDNTVIGTGIEWVYGASGYQNVNWGTVGYWASLRGASPLATDDGLNFLRIDHPAPFANIKYWEIGNEVYGNWEVDYHGNLGPGDQYNGKAFDPETYVTFAKTFSTFAAEITSAAGLPSISIGIDSGDPTGASDNDWTKNVLTDGLAIGFVPNFISDHNYVQAPGQENDQFLLNDTVSDSSSITDWSVRYADYQALLQQTLGSQASGVSVMATEFNSVYSEPGKETTSLVNGLFMANALGSLLDSGYSGAIAWDLSDPYNTTTGNSSEALYGWRDGGDYGLLGDSSLNDAPTNAPTVPFPAYFSEQLASKFIVAGGEVESVSTNYQDFDAYAVMEANGHLELLVINTNPAASLTEQFDLSGFQPSGAAQFWQYGEAQDTAQSQSSTGAAALANFTATLSLSGANFTYSFPAYSMTVIDLAPQAAAVPVPVKTKNNKGPGGSPITHTPVTYTPPPPPTNGGGNRRNWQQQSDDGSLDGPIATVTQNGTAPAPNLPSTLLQLTGGSASTFNFQLPLAGAGIESPMFAIGLPSVMNLDAPITGETAAVTSTTATGIVISSGNTTTAPPSSAAGAQLATLARSSVTGNADADADPTAFGDLATSSDPTIAQSLNALLGQVANHIDLAAGRIDHSSDDVDDADRVQRTWQKSRQAAA